MGSVVVGRERVVDGDEGSVGEVEDWLYVVIPVNEVVWVDWDVVFRFGGRGWFEF